MKINQLLKKGRSILAGREKEAELLLAHLLKTHPHQLLLLKEREISKEVERTFLEGISFLEKGMPLQYITGEVYFMNVKLKTEEGVFIPRPETELLVERILEILPEDFEGKGLDIGGGTGCISIALLKERKNLVMYSTDINERAVELMKINSRINEVSERFFPEYGDLLGPFKNMKFDFIVSNPPYIPYRRWHYLDESVKKEGFLSLIGGREGTEFYKRLAKEVVDVLDDNGFIAFEIGHDQGKRVKDILEREGFKVKIFRDFNNQDRVVIGWK